MPLPFHRMRRFPTGHSRLLARAYRLKARPLAGRRSPLMGFRVHAELRHIDHLWICDRYRWIVDSIAGNDSGNTANRKHKSRYRDQLRWQIPLHSGLRNWLGQHFRYQRGRIAYQPRRCGRYLRCCWLQWHSCNLVVGWTSCSIRSQLARFLYRPVPRATVATLTVDWAGRFPSRADRKCIQNPRCRSPAVRWRVGLLAWGIHRI